MNAKFKKVSVIGLGYIGLPTAAVLASRGLDVVGVDINPKTVEIINSGKIHIVEPDLEIIVRSVVNTGNLKAVIDPEPADVFIITVPTPFKENYQPDLSFIDAVVKSIAPVLQKGNLIILESTSPVGTTESISQQLAKLRIDLTFPHQDVDLMDIHIAYCPERVMPGQILRELIDNDRIIGGITPKCTEMAKSLYQLFVTGGCFNANSRTAEMAKLTENAYRDVNIAFANELSIICDKLQINVWKLIQLANRHPRVQILQPGPGVGGHCIAVDPWFIVNSTPEEARLIRTAREINDYKPLFVLEKIYKAMALFEHPRIACLGVAYKANTDDLRESPAIKILDHLGQSTQATVHIVEPNIRNLPHTLSCYSKFSLETLEVALANANIIVLMVAHKEFQVLTEIDLQNKFLIDIANLEATHSTAINPIKKKQQPISEYGLMMMNRIYGNFLT